MAEAADYAAGYTAEQIIQGIVEAVKARDFPAVVALLKMLAVRDPHAAQVIYDSMMIVVGGEGMPGA